jgi:peptidyl-prolyl cis-trans isomerase D
MAIIGKIREKSGLTIVLLGLAMFAFIMGGWDNMFGSSNQPIGLGEVYGEKIDPIEYEKTVQTMVMSDQQQYAQQQRPYTEADKKQSENRAWTMLVEEKILEKEYEKLGIDVSKNEFDAYLYGTDGFTVMPSLAQNFMDSVTGQFNPRLLEKRITEMETSTDPRVSADWESTKTSFINQRKNEKYYQILAQGAYVTKLEGKEEYKAQKEVKSVSYVIRRYSEIPDEQIKVTEDEVKAYYEEHKNEKKYESTAGRDVKYFDINIIPSKKDSTDFNKVLKTIKDGFTKSKNDSLYVLANSEFKFFTSTRQSTLRPEGDAKAQPGLTFPAAMDTVFKMATPGQIVGPYVDNGKFRIAKVRGFNNNVCKVRHILLKAEKGDSLKLRAVRKMADTLILKINKDNFTEYVTKYSEDPGSKSTGGVYDNFLDFEMVPQFSKFAVEKPVGTIGMVTTDFGIHIIEVMDRKAVKYPIVSFIEKTLEPSSETKTNATDEAYDVLNELDEKIYRKNSPKAKLDLFDTIAKQKGYFSRPVKILDENPSAQGFATTMAEDAILKLAYDENSEVGTLCSKPIIDGNRYIIAIVSSVREKGVPAFIDVQESMKLEVIKQKKADRFIAQIGKQKNLNVLAKKGKTIVNKAEVTFANPQLQGYEPEVVGALFSALKDGSTVVLKGEQGVYVVQVNKTLKAPAVNDYTMETTQLLNSMRGNQQGEAKMALIKLADVKDNRRFAFLGIRR